MMRNISILFIILMPFFLRAQPQKYSTSSKAAIRSYEDGMQHYNARSNDKAIESLKDAIKKDTAFVEAYMLLATVYEEKKMPDEAIVAYRKSFEAKPDAFPYNYFVCAKLEVKTCRYADAKAHFEKYLQYKNADARRKKEVDQYIKSCSFAMEAMKNPVPFSPQNIGKGVNSEFPEYYFSFSVDQKTLIFTRDITDRRSPFGHQEDFFISKYKDGIWQPAVQLDKPLNTEDNEGAPSISADGRYVFYTACNRKESYGSCDLFLSTYSEDDKWTMPVNLGPPINTGLWESQPSFSSDGITLYFTRRVKGERGDNMDLFCSTFQSNYKWSEPVSLGNTINTPGNEESVFIHPDNQTLYFSSDGHVGMGGLDIYMSRRMEDGSWGEVINLGYPINTCRDENSLVVSADGKKGYFSAEREEGFGSLDIFSFDLAENLKPLLTSYVRARVTDYVSERPLSAEFEIIDVETGKVVVKNTTDKFRGEFLACLPAGKVYMLNVSKESYMFYSASFDCTKPTTEQLAFEINVPLKKITSGASIVLRNIFFDVDKFDLKSESFSELDKLVNFLNANAAVKIEISGHTDNTGDKQKNQKLSENRAKSVMDYLLSKNIAATRLSSRGYGDTRPVADNASDAGRASNRRTEITVK